ncbi:lanC-like protein 2 [Zootermopsis nevadensis]|uniref:LanC-like protein 2 n=1 Tax=Zootermopsis nevadensis TaxID=136037 RepID=A0A067RHF6_ZOONE|nr:lanC-like protein 2 [Zootermopsis nevadensis]KDR23212.1 LanC-like protein 2 [Zootermopsis nevadensis]
MADKREFKNPYDDFVPNKENSGFNLEDGKILQDFQEKLLSAINKLLTELHAGLHESDSHDYSVYTGTSGIALLYILMSQRLDNSYEERALKMTERVLSKLKNHRVSFLNGDAGPLAIGALLYHRQGVEPMCQECIDRLKKMLPQVLNLSSDLPDEILYGRTGYLFALLYLHKHLGQDIIDSKIIQQVVSAVLSSGKKLAQQEGRNVPLMYMWHGKYYLGAAHGISGILYMLLQAKDYMSESDLNNLVRPTIDYLQGLCFPSGNFPSSLGNNTDRLVQWCHGAPGIVFLFAQAYKVFGDDQYLQTALKCGDVVWRRGMLSKGYSICHGVAGNGYTFLVLYHLTGDLKHLHRACKFAEWCMSYGKQQYHTPDRPLSLFEGISGVIHFLVDVQEPKLANFPAFTL